MIRRIRNVPCLAAVTRTTAIVMLIVVAGCGEERGKSDLSGVELVIGQIASVSGAAGEPNRERWEGLFVEGTAPDDAQRAKYAPLQFVWDRQKVSLSGTTATATITVMKSADGQPVGEPVEWEFVGEGTSWKIKNAPLPSGI